MTEQDDPVQVIAREIARYLGEHPRAGDTVEGIRTWWLAARHEGSLRNVLKALDVLVERGVVHARMLPAGTTFYSRAAPTPPASQRAGDDPNPDKERP